ncbi:MAG: hypothetical protein JRJ79_16350 [Deltaproteobacteria bacterium]|nr:hypothetical protein [Deltaproteobacteria bacterium]MBW1796330.1 hypothetical protein [Deltaproteobacteria bacterium]
MKRLFFGIIFILLILAAPHTPQAMVTGECVNCHTMHNSQMGGEMAYDFSGTTFSKTATPKPTLLIYSCVGCHTRAGTDTSTIDGGVPIVFNVTDPVKPLAGGNFHYLTADGQGDASGHNVLGIVGQGALGLTPPGGTAMDAQLRCAGTYGCHGNRSETDQLEAMKTAHHTNDTGGITATSVGLSYRFLLGVKGAELNEEGYKWEQNADSTHHNGYYGVSAYNDSDTISYLCGKCHGNFHAHTALGGASQVGTGSPWLRHPTDKLLSGGEYANYTTYNVLAPPALDTPSTSTDNITGKAIVMCLSCHRAHASPYYKMIRWNYRGDGGASLTVQLSGCIVCHTSKN